MKFGSQKPNFMRFGAQTRKLGHFEVLAKLPFQIPDSEIALPDSNFGPENAKNLELS